MSESGTQGNAQAVLYEKKDNIAVITLNRPEVLNAVNQALMQGLSQALDQAEGDDEVRAIILTGAGRAFCAGADLQQMSRRQQSEAEAPAVPSIRSVDVYLKIWQLSKPVIAAVAGYALGQGCEMAGICDITIAAREAKFGEIQIRHGWGPVILVMPFLVGLKKAKELMLSGDLIDAHEAERIGLVNRVVPADRLLDEAEALARKIAALPHAAVRLDKALINRSYDLLGFTAAVNYSQEEIFADLSLRRAMSDEESLSRLRVLQEQGWEAFIRERDARYRNQEGQG